MKHSPSWEAKIGSVSQEINRILWNPKVKHHIHKISPNGPYPEPDEPSPHTSNLFPYDPL